MRKGLTFSKKHRSGMRERRITMSQILSKDSKKVVYETTRALEGIRCDVCKKIIPINRIRKHESMYYEVMTGHNDWGNDSYESIRWQDICPNCISGFMCDYVEKTAYNSAYLEVNRRYCYPKDVRCDE